MPCVIEWEVPERSHRVWYLRAHVEGGTARLDRLITLDPERWELVQNGLTEEDDLYIRAPGRPDRGANAWRLTLDGTDCHRVGYVRVSDGTPGTNADPLTHAWTPGGRLTLSATEALPEGPLLLGKWGPGGSKARDLEAIGPVTLPWRDPAPDLKGHRAYSLFRVVGDDLLEVTPPHEVRGIRLPPVGVDPKVTDHGDRFEIAPLEPTDDPDVSWRVVARRREDHSWTQLGDMLPGAPFSAPWDAWDQIRVVGRSPGGEERIVEIALANPLLAPVVPELEMSCTDSDLRAWRTTQRGRELHLEWRQRLRLFARIQRSEDGVHWTDLTGWEDGPGGSTPAPFTARWSESAGWRRPDVLRMWVDAAPRDTATTWYRLQLRTTRGIESEPGPALEVPPYRSDAARCDPGGDFDR